MTHNGYYIYEHTFFFTLLAPPHKNFYLSFMVFSHDDDDDDEFHQHVPCMCSDCCLLLAVILHNIWDEWHISLLPKRSLL